jgi:hypothetical protein
MLHHQTDSTEETSVSANARVTPEELAKALAAIEARQEQSATETANTIPIGDAIRQLGFDASSDEIWTEVQAQRQSQVQTIRTRMPRKVRLRLWLAACAGVFGLVGIISAIDTQNTTSNVQITAPPMQMMMPPAPRTFIKTLAEIQNHETFYCDADTAEKILKGSVPLSQILVTDGAPTQGQEISSSWEFTKNNGKLSLHGFMAPRSPAAMQAGEIPIYNMRFDDTGEGGLNYSEPLTLPLGKFKLVAFTGAVGPGIQQIVESDISPGVG